MLSHGFQNPEISKSDAFLDLQESESEEDGLDEGDEDIDVEEEQDIESEVPVPTEHAIKKPSPATVVPKEAERQLSKKELKKKELAELEAVLAEFGLQNNNGQDEPHGRCIHINSVCQLIL